MEDGRVTADASPLRDPLLLLPPLVRHLFKAKLQSLPFKSQCLEGRHTCFVLLRRKLQAPSLMRHKYPRNRSVLSGCHAAAREAQERERKDGTTQASLPIHQSRGSLLHKRLHRQLFLANFHHSTHFITREGNFFAFFLSLEARLQPTSRRLLLCSFSTQAAAGQLLDAGSPFAVDTKDPTTWGFMHHTRAECVDSGNPFMGRRSNDDGRSVTGKGSRE